VGAFVASPVLALSRTTITLPALIIQMPQPAPTLAPVVAADSGR